MIHVGRYDMDCVDAMGYTAPKTNMESNAIDAL